MCGIVGYIGSKKVVPVIIEGLRKLEYHGYDSAGIAVVGTDGKLQLRRAPGKLRNLEEAVAASPIDGTYGIGHTRWATHGRPTEENAHPHRDCTGQYVVVHNGIIENYFELKEKLQLEGHKFAALIAPMIKVAMQSVVSCAHDPREVLRGLNRVLFAQLRTQLVSAAYLWLDTENRIALYSAAGHPPLLHCREGKLERIESNGLLFGVLPNSDYPLCDMPVLPGDRFLLYTDGVIEPENALGHSFGEHKLEQVIHNNQSRPPSELLDQLLSEIRQWQPASMAQNDDITLIAIDVV